MFLYTRRPTSTVVNPNGGGTNFVSTFPNSGGTTGGATTTPPTNISGYTPPATAPNTVIKLVKVSTMPIAGFTVFSKERLKVVPTDNTDTTTPVTTPTTTKNTTAKKAPAPLTEFAPALRYVSRANGNIYETFADTIEEQKNSQTVIPQVYEAYFGNGGNSVVMQYLKPDNATIETFVGSLPKENVGTVLDGTNQVQGTFLPDNTKDVSISTDNSSMFYLFDLEDSMIGTTLNFLTNKKVQVFESPFTEWLPQWTTNSMITLTTKPASGIPGYMYELNPSTKSLTDVLSNINGLTTLTSPNGKLVLYSNDGLSLSIYKIATGATNTLGVKTLAEKCAWNADSSSIYCAVPRNINSAQYPDAWYQGEVSFSDEIWQIDVASGNATMLVDPLTIAGGQDIDGIKLAVDSGENYLFFVNKKDSYLWELALK